MLFSFTLIDLLFFMWECWNEVRLTSIRVDLIWLVWVKTEQYFFFPFIKLNITTAYKKGFNCEKSSWSQQIHDDGKKIMVQYRD